MNELSCQHIVKKIWDEKSMSQISMKFSEMLENDADYLLNNFEGWNVHSFWDFEVFKKGSILSRYWWVFARQNLCQDIASKYAN